MSVSIRATFTPALASRAAFSYRTPSASYDGMLSSGSTKAGTLAPAISPAICHASCAPASTSFSLNSRASRNAVAMSLRRLAYAIRGSWPCSTGSRASRSAAEADRGRSCARPNSARRRSYSSASRNTRRTRSTSAAREPPAKSFPVSESFRTTPTGDLTSISSIVLPARSMSTAWPLTRFPAGTASTVVTPSIRVTEMTTDAGLIPSATLKEAAMVSPLSRASRVPATAPISTRPICPAPSMRPGVTHFPVASMRAASGGTATPVPTAAILPSRIRTVALAILGPETGYTVPPVIAIVWASRNAIIGRSSPRRPASGRAGSRCGAGERGRSGRTQASRRCRPGSPVSRRRRGRPTRRPRRRSCPARASR